MVCMGSPDTAQAPALPSTTPPAFDVYQTGLDGKTVNRLRDEAAALVFRLSSTFPIVDDKTAMFACTNDEPEHCWKLWSAVVKRAKLHWERVELILNGRREPGWPDLARFTHGLKSVLDNYGNNTSISQLLVYMELLADRKEQFETGTELVTLSHDQAMCKYSLLLPAAFDLTSKVLSVTKVLIEEGERTWTGQPVYFDDDDLEQEEYSTLAVKSS